MAGLLLVRLGLAPGSLVGVVEVAAGDPAVELIAGVALSAGAETVEPGTEVMAGEQPAVSTAVIKGRASRERRDNSNHFLDRFREGSNLHTDAGPG